MRIPGAWTLLLIAVMVFIQGEAVSAQPLKGGPSLTLPKVSLTFQETRDPKAVVPALQLTLLLTILTLAPALLILLTAFTRIVIVLSLLRQAMGTPQIPPNQVLIGLSLFLTFFVMAPVLSEMDRQALQPYLAKKISGEEALERAAGPLRQFMFRQTREEDLAVMVQLARLPRPKDLSQVPTSTLIPAFVLGEIRTAFQIGFVLFLPFLIVDMVVTSILLSMGMLFLPPAMISLPLKILLFVMADGWTLVVKSLVAGFR